MTDKTRFRPAVATEAEIEESSMHPGWVYFASDTGKIFFDIDESTRMLMGGSGASILYGKAPTLASDENSDNIVYNFSTSYLENSEANPQVNDIILNVPDGRFYRIQNIEDNNLVCILLAVSGSGSSSSPSGGGTTSQSQKIKVSIESPKTTNLINGQDFSLSFTAESGLDSDGSALDTQLVVYLTLEEKSGNSYTTYWTGQLDVAPGVATSYDFTDLLRESTTTRISVKAEGIESGVSASKYVTLTTAALSLALSSSFSTLTRYSPSKMILSCEAVGSMNKILKFYWDDALVETRHLTSTSDNTQTYPVAASLATHGAHKVRIELYQAIVISNQWTEALSVAPLEFEVAVEGSGETEPIIWLGTYQSSYYNYDSIQIPYLVYDPTASGTTVEVTFKKNSQTIRTATPVNASTNVKSWNIWEIADADLDMVNYYQICCGDIVRDITFTVEQDPNRSMELVQQDYLTLNFDAKGRSNTESTTSRATWKTGSISANFENFNWYNNGWVLDDTNATCLRISNGAHFSIPFGAMQLNTSNKTNQSATFEFQFKIRNVQNYGKLISNITRYTGDDAFYTAFKAQTKYDNYDSFLHYYLPIYPVDNESKRVSYDDLSFSKIEKEIAIDKACASFYAGSGSNIVGFGIGAQDAFFSNGRDIVNVQYVEDKIVNLSMVYSYSSKMLYIYLNGVITGVIKNSSAGDTFTIGADTVDISDGTKYPATIDFFSDFCDIDLYKFRIYTTDLNVNEIVQNYSVDLKDITIFDQNSLAKDNSVLNEYQFSYEKMIEYNASHTNAPLMPYVIFDTTENSEDVLSYSKKVNRIVGVEFVNTGLELAYQNGELLQWAIADGLCTTSSTAEEKEAAVKKYYLHHCPSWTGKNCNLAVQGTSSEFYPRRNYKVKTKTTYDADGAKRVHMFLNRGPYADDYAADKKNTNNFTVFTEMETVTNEDGTTKQVAGKNLKLKSQTKWFYFNNYDVGTNKFTCKIDFMESSGSYNMGFANLVKNAYSKHPIADYNYTTVTGTDGKKTKTENAFVHKIDGTSTELTEYPTSLYDATTNPNGTKICYLSHKGEWKTCGEDDLPIPTAEEFAAGPYALAAAKGVYKILGGNKDDKAVPTIANTSSLTEAEIATLQANIDKYVEANTDLATVENGFNKWFVLTPESYTSAVVEDVDSLRTSVQGFRVLAFHKKKTAGTSGSQYQYIGMYNILADKGSDEMYGFVPSDGDLRQKYVDNKPVEEVAECWEFENNNRGFCSFRDPWKRKELSFRAPVGATNEFTANLAPVVADSFEYRYNVNADYLDLLYELKTTIGNQDNATTITTAFPDYQIFGEDPNPGRELLLSMYTNWERAVKWVWSTDTDSVKSSGKYQEITVGDTDWKANTYYVFTKVTEHDDETNTDVEKEVYAKEFDTPGKGDYYYSDTLDCWFVYAPTVKENTTYYTKEPTTDKDGVALKDDNGNIMYSYKNAHVSVNKYAPETYYVCVDADSETYSLCSDTAFDSSLTYYELSEYPEEELAKIADRLVTPATGDYDATATYYTYDGTATIGTVTTEKVETPSEEDFKAGKYYVEAPKTYGSKTYKFDTKEYRSDKFKYELKYHFDIEYMATYFIMTEVFECYDSRGKNCMMASWGPVEAGGDYIWYPIFYDIDTQLGINNTGIPSFEFNVDATEDGNYSTSDSILWNNFYKYFKSSYITQKYKQLKGSTDNIPESWGGSTPLAMPPLKDVATIEAWYTTDPYCAKNTYNDGNATYSIPDYEKTGARPLIAVNLDEYYKYITITNTASAGISSGECGKLTDDGKYEADTSATFFYALQGDRSLSRQQFLANRLEYIDSWLNQGNYQRGGQNRIVGRVAANNSEKTSDIWVNDGYFDANGNKLHGFDAEYWINLTPIRSSYVTLSDDNAAYPSEKYDGVTPVKFEITAIENGVKNSANYPEQLLYIYGMNQMADLGDMSNLYWQEFKIEGDATKLTALRLGYDGLMTDPKGILVEADDSITGNDVITYNGKKYYRWHNDKMNLPTIPSSDEDANGMPLLKEVNLSNITINTGSPSINLKSCEKLEDFRATGSNFSTISFADGVALNTLYLPSSITSLNLVEANLLTKLIKEYKYPVYNTKTSKLEAEPGLYIQGLFDDAQQTNIQTLNLVGGSLGYGSYELLKKWFDCRLAVVNATPSGKPTSYLNMTKVNWCPYVQLVDGDTVDESDLDNYYLDNGHYGFTPYGSTYNKITVNADIANGIVYKKDSSIANSTISEINDASMEMFKELIDNNYFLGTNNNAAVPNITGIVYVENTTPIEETYIRNTLGVKFPQLTFFFANVNKAYTAKFIIEDENGVQSYVSFINTKITEKSVQKIESGWFTNPYTLYNPTKEAYDFHGWSTTNDDTGLIATADSTEEEKAIAWDNVVNQLAPNGITDRWNADGTHVYDYVFYAVFTIHKWDINFWVGTAENNMQAVTTIKATHGTVLSDLNYLVSYTDSSLGEYDRYRFLGWTQNINNVVVTNESSAKLINFASITASGDMNFYAVLMKEDVRTSVTDLKYFDFTLVTKDTARSAYKDGTEILLKANSGYIISPKSGMTIAGKITLPTTYNDKPVVSVDGFKNQSKLTGVFWYGDDNLLEVYGDPNAGTGAFRQCENLTYFQMPSTVKLIGANAFMNCPKLNIELQGCKQLDTIATQAFNGSLGGVSGTFIIPGSVREVGISTFSWMAGDYSSQDIYLGGIGDPSQIAKLGQYAFFTPTLNSFSIYCAGGVPNSYVSSLFGSSSGGVNTLYVGNSSDDSKNSVTYLPSSQS